MDYNYSKRTIEFSGTIDQIVDRIEIKYLTDNDINRLHNNHSIELNKRDVAYFIAYSIIISEDYRDNSDESITNANFIFDNYQEIIEGKEKYQALQIANTRLVLCYSELKKGIALDILLFMLDFLPEMLTNNTINYNVITKATIRLLFKCIKVLDTPLQKCVFKSLIESQRKEFDAEDIFISCYGEPSNSDSRQCDRLTCDCGKRNNDQSCGVSIHDIDAVLKCFESKNIICVKGDKWVIVP